MMHKGRHERSAIANFLNPVNGYRGQMELSGMTPKDHRKDNINFIKHKQKELKHKMDESLKPKPDLFKMK